MRTENASFTLAEIKSDNLNSYINCVFNISGAPEKAHSNSPILCIE